MINQEFSRTPMGLGFGWSPSCIRGNFVASIPSHMGWSTKITEESKAINNALGIFSAPCTLAWCFANPFLSPTGMISNPLRVCEIDSYVSYLYSTILVSLDVIPLEGIWFASSHPRNFVEDKISSMKIKGYIRGMFFFFMFYIFIEYL